ncbi:MAG: methyltransferase type 11 [Bacteroidetes bacterium]|nr:MAG: methyltransferase type 11 [Bacteroidota bacterium]
MTSDKQFWGSKAKAYDRIITLLSHKGYRLIYEFIKAPLTKEMQVLEVGTGTGLIAKKIADRVQHVEATDFSEEMIATAQKTAYPSNIHFSCANIFKLPFDNQTFDVVVASNMLHIIPEPEKAMTEIKRVLKPNGLLIAPTFLWKELRFFGKIQRFFMLLKRFPLKTEWNEETFKSFITDNGFTITKFEIINLSFAIGCVTATLKDKSYKLKGKK